MSFAFAQENIMLNYIPCEKKVFDILLQWSSSYEWRMGYRDQNSKLVKSPLAKVGHWAKLKVEGNDVALIKQTPDMALTITMKGPQCTPKVATVLSKKDKGGFTDRVLKRILDRSRKRKTSGMIYAWSNRMNLSIQGALEAKKVAGELNFEFYLVHDSHISNKSHFPPSLQSINSSKIQSVELIEKGMKIHFPSIIFYRNGVLDKYVRPGYDNPQRLRKILQDKASK